MKRFTCECGSQEFKTNPSMAMVQCWHCGLRYTWDGKWKAFRVNKVVSYSESFRELVQKPIDWVETKLRHPIKMKRFESEEPIDFRENQKYFLKKMAKLKSDNEKIKAIHLKKKWAPELRIIKRHDKVTFDDYAHKGKLRGKHIAKAFHCDAKKLGIKTRLRFVRDKGVVEAVK